MKDTGRNTNKIENNKKIVKEKEKSNNKKNKTKRIYQQKISKIFVRERKKKNDKYEGHAFKPQNQSFVLQCVG